MKRTNTEIGLISVSALFIIVMLVVPLLSVIVNSLQEGFTFYAQSLMTKNVTVALRNTLLAAGAALLVNTVFGLVAAWAVTNYDFPGKHFFTTLIDIPFSISPVIVGLAFIMTFGRAGWLNPYMNSLGDWLGVDIRIVFALPGVLLATIFVTFPFVFREILPVLSSQGKDEEEAAALMGASGWRIFSKITFPKIKWALLYGVILCTARALGEFGAVYAVARTRGQTFTLPLEIDALYMSGKAASITAAFAVSSLLVMIAILVLILRSIAERKGNHIS